MCAILKFPLERVQRRSLGLPDLSHNADVLFFEGVRYDNKTKAADSLKVPNSKTQKPLIKS